MDLEMVGDTTTLNNVITIEKLSAAMNLGKLGEQYVLKSEKAFESISFDGYWQDTNGRRESPSKPYMIKA